MKTITGVPESITRAQYLDMIAAAGFDPDHLRSLTFSMTGIFAEVIRQQSRAGNGWFDRVGGICTCSDHSEAVDMRCCWNERVVERVFIPIEG